MQIRSLTLLCTAAAAVAVACAAAAQVVVLSARGPSANTYPQGAVLPASRVLTLKAGDRLELLDGAGSHVVTGPGNVLAGHMDKGAEARLMDIFLKSQAARPGIAATRGFELQPPPPSNDDGRLWQIDAKVNGNVCIASGAAPTLARGPGPSPIRIVRMNGGDTTVIDWAAGGSIADWPSNLPIAEGETYSIAMSDGTNHTLVWRTVGSAGRGMEPLATEMLAKGCHVQLDRLRVVVAGQ